MKQQNKNYGKNIQEQIHRNLDYTKLPLDSQIDLKEIRSTVYEFKIQITD